MTAAISIYLCVVIIVSFPTAFLLVSSHSVKHPTPSHRGVSDTVRQPVTSQVVFGLKNVMTGIALPLVTTFVEPQPLDFTTMAAQWSSFVDFLHWAGKRNTMHTECVA